MSELPEGMAPAQVPEPRDSASAIVLRRGADREWEVLLGLRSRRSPQRAASGSEAGRNKICRTMRPRT